MIEQTIKSETQAVADAFKTLVNSQRENMSGFINTIISGENGTPSDAAIEVDPDGITVYQFAPDKGYVLAEVEGQDVPVQLARYKNLADGAKYLATQKDGPVVFCVKTKAGTPDAVLGRWKTLNDAIADYTSEPVKVQYKKWLDYQEILAKEATKTEARLKKLSGGKITEAEVVPDTTTVPENNG